MDFVEIIRILRRSWWMAALSLVAVVGSAAFFSIRQTPVYQATATMVVWPTKRVTETSDIVRSLDTLDRRVVIATYAKILPSRAVLDRVGDQMRLTPDQMGRYKVRAVVVPDTNILSISVEGPDPRLVTRLANVVAEQARSYVEETYDIFGLNPLDPASEPLSPIRPEVSRNLTTAAILGLLLGLGWVFLIEYSRRFRQVIRAQRPWEAERDLAGVKADERATR